MKNTDRKAEEKYLQETMQVIQDNLANYSGEVSRMQGEIDEMLEHYHDNDVELWTLLNNTITMNEHMKRAMQRNERASHKPYFGRIIFRDETLGKQESLYIGKGGISRDSTHWMVVDWRAPVANAYYENGLGKCSYTAPAGKEIPIDLQMKRTFEIEDGRLLDYFDTEVVANDDLLMKYLSRNKEAVLGEIVATIQKEQNEIIRKSPYHNLIVQGVAGSGKTTVAMHRISFILYNYQERFRPEDFYIVGSNRILLDYITGVLPDLDVHGVKQMTMEQLFIRLLYEDWDEKKYKVRSVSGSQNIIKGTEDWFLALEDYIRRLEWDTIRRDSIYLEPRQFVEGLKDGRNGIYDRREEDEKAGIRSKPVCLVERGAVERYITQNPAVSIQSKINMLNERLIVKIRDEFSGKGVTYTEGERKAILKAYRGYYGGTQWKRSIYELYREFLSTQRERYTPEDSDPNVFDVYDLAALALLYKRVKETEVISEAHHVVIDEAQDFGMMAYRVLNACIKDCTYTVMGDVSQNIHFGFGLRDWEALKKLLLPDPMDSFGILRKSYRNTIEISEFATNILRHGSFSIYPAEPIIRHGSQVIVERAKPDASREELLGRAAGICREWQEQKLDTIAVVCRDKEEALHTASQLSDYIDILESNLEKVSFGKGIMVLPVEYTKGLEFDAVLILNPTKEAYPVDDGHAKLLYVAATRALHELHILCQGECTGLLDPAPERNAAETADSAGRVEPAGTADSAGRAEPARTADSAGRAEYTAAADEEAARAREKRETAPAKPENGKPGRLRVRADASVFRPQGSPESCRSPENMPVRPGAAVPASGKMPAAEAVLTAAARTLPAFGDMPPTEMLRPRGHARINLGVKWVSKQSDGLYLQSQYGTLRVSPVGSGILRMTFAKGAAVKGGTHPLIFQQKTEHSWKYRDNGRTVELTTGEVTLQVEKATGGVRYLDAKGSLLLSERRLEGRQCDEKGSWLFLDLQKGEQLFAGHMGAEMGAGNSQGPLKLRGSARYISAEGCLPFLLSDKGYGLLPAVSGACISCDIPAYGTYLYMDGQEQQDYYFIAGKQQQNILNAYRFLCGEL